MAPKVRINSPDGLPQNTKVTTDDGTEIAGVSAISFTITGDDVARVDLAFIEPEFKAEGEAYVDEETLRALAESHGFDLVPK